MSKTSKKAVFLDKDGTVVRNIPHNSDPERIELLPGVLEGISMLQRAGYQIHIVTNQPGVALGHFPLEDLSKVEARLRELLSEGGVDLHAFHFCPHHPEGRVEAYATHCECRKPRPGMILKAAEQYDIDLESSWFIGDILDDVEAGRRAGCKTVLISNGNETEWEYSENRVPDLVHADVFGAAFAVTASTLNGNAE